MSETDIDTLLADAQTALRSKEYATARDLIDAVRRLDPDNADAARLMRFVQVALSRNRTSSDSKTTSPQNLAGTTQSVRKRRTAPSGITRSEASEDEVTRHMRSTYESGDFEGTLRIANTVLNASPDHEMAQKYKRFAELALGKSGRKERADRKTIQLAASQVLKRRKKK